jgi:hypothetical protein
MQSVHSIGRMNFRADERHSNLEHMVMDIDIHLENEVHDLAVEAIFA